MTDERFIVYGLIKFIMVHSSNFWDNCLRSFECELMKVTIENVLRIELDIFISFTTWYLVHAKLLIQ